MKRNLVRTVAAAWLGGAAMLSQAATVYYSDWAYGNSWNNIVNVANPAHNGAAGGFKGSVTFEDTEKVQGFTDIAADGFISYCVEITESFYGFPSSQMTDYSVVAGALYATGNYTAWGTAKAN